jgi:pimeloyl-ACP methyl ester carboxylesterase
MPHELSSFDADGVSLSYEIFGRGDRVVVYLHGMLFDSLLNHGLANDLAGAGYRVILLDFPGHGRSEKPRTIATHRVDLYADQVVRLLDHLGIHKAVIGGFSLGADVALRVAEVAPERVSGLIVEMPVLERSLPAALVVFAPVFVISWLLAPIIRLIVRGARHLPRHRMGLTGAALSPLTLEPEEVLAVLRGMMVGPIVPTVGQRGSLSQPALIIGHRFDQLHSLRDASRLASVMPNAQFVEARSILELRRRPARLTSAIIGFLDTTNSSRSAREKSAPEEAS